MSFTPATLQPARPGATDAAKVPSLTNGQRTAHKPPVLMARPVLKPVGFAK